MKILGLDLALGSFGYSVVEVNRKGDVSVVLIGSTNTTKIKGRGKKLKFIMKQMEYLKTTHSPDILLIERPFFRHIKSTQALFSVLGVTQVVFEDLEPIEISASTIKKVVGGHGRSSKEDVEKGVRKTFPKVRLTNLDESDALGLVITYLKQEGVL